MSAPPESEHTKLRKRLRTQAMIAPNALLSSADLIILLDYVDELEASNYSGWENSMGEDL